jgi:xylulokinase
MDPAARGAILGLSLATTKGELIRGFVEGITYEFRENLTRLEAAGLQVENLVATGGGAKSSFWLQLRADMTGRPLHTVNIKETGCFAAACVAGASVGAFASVAEAIDDLVHRETEFEPRPALTARYDELFATYQEVYPAISGINTR